MFDSATYYVDSYPDEGRSHVSHDGVTLARFASHDDALRIATHLAFSASEMGMASRVIERLDERHAAVVFESGPIAEEDLPWDAIGD